MSEIKKIREELDIVEEKILSSIKPFKINNASIIKITEVRKNGEVDKLFYEELGFLEKLIPMLKKHSNEVKYIFETMENLKKIRKKILEFDICLEPGFYKDLEKIGIACENVVTPLHILRYYLK